MPRLTVALLLLLFSLDVLGEEIHCFKDVELKITNVYPKIKFSESKLRKDSIQIRKIIDCQTKLEIVPTNYQQALKTVAFSLPNDYLAASIISYLKEGEPNLSLYLYSDYGLSVDEDLIDFFHTAWELDEKNNVCKKELGGNKTRNINQDDKDIEVGCFMLLKEHLMKMYVMNSDLNNVLN